MLLLKLLALQQVLFYELLRNLIIITVLNMHVGISYVHKIETEKTLKVTKVYSTKKKKVARFFVDRLMSSRDLLSLIADTDYCIFLHFHLQSNFTLIYLSE